MNLRELLLLIKRVANKTGISEPFLVGGVPRDKILKRLDTIKDLDLTTGDESVKKLAKEAATIFQKEGGKYKEFDDGHSKITIGPVSIDFSSNFTSPSVEEFLKKSGVKDPTDMQKELYSRDFTVNTLLMPLDLNSIKDPTGLALNDIKKKIIKTTLGSNITLANDPKRIVRTIYLAAKLDFNVDPEIIEWVRENPDTISNVSNKFISEKLQKAIDYDLDKTVKLLDEMSLWNHIPLLTALIPYASKIGRI